MLRSFLIFIFAALWLWSIAWAIRFTIFAYDYARILVGSSEYRRAEMVVQDAGWRRFGAVSRGKYGPGAAGVRIFQVEGVVEGSEEVMRVPEEEVKYISVAPGDKTGDKYSAGAVLDVWYNPNMGGTVNHETLRVAPYGSQFFENTRKKLWVSLIGGYTPLLVMLMFSFWWRKRQIERFGF